MIMGTSNYRRSFKKKICDSCKDPCYLYQKNHKPHFQATRPHKIPVNSRNFGQPEELYLYCAHYDTIGTLEKEIRDSAENSRVLN